MYFFIKVVASALIIAIASELEKRSTIIGAQCTSPSIGLD